MRIRQELIDEQIGRTHGRLTVISHKGKNRRGQNTFLCQCECGNYRVCSLAELNCGVMGGPRACFKCSKSRLSQRFHGLMRSAAELESKIVQRGSK